MIGNSLPPSQVATLQKTSGVQVQQVPGLGYTFMTYNVKHKPLDNVLVREALAHAVDTNTILKVVLQGQGKLTNSQAIAPVLSQWGNPSAKATRSTPRCRSSCCNRPATRPIERQFPADADPGYSLIDPVISQMVTLVRDEAAQAGITIKLQGFDRNTFLQKGVSGDFDIYGARSRSRTTRLPACSWLSNQVRPTTTRLPTIPIAHLLYQAQTATDNATQVKLAQQAAQMVQDKVYDNVLFMQNLAVAYRKGWTGFVVQPSQLLSIVGPESLSNVKFTG